MGNKPVKNPKEVKPKVSEKLEVPIAQKVFDPSSRSDYQKEIFRIQKLKIVMAKVTSTNSLFDNATKQTQLPPEILNFLLSWLSPFDVVLRVSLVSKELYNAANHDETWKKISLKSMEPYIHYKDSQQKWKTFFWSTHIDLHVRELRKTMDDMYPPFEQHMVLRMFHPLNARDNFDPLQPSVSETGLPPKETLIKILSYENELRLSAKIQDMYLNPDYDDMKITEDVQQQAVEAFGYHDRNIIPAALVHYKDDKEIQNIPHYVKFNRSRIGNVQVGDLVDHLNIQLEPLKETESSKQWTEILQKSQDKPLVLVSGSYT